MLIVATSKRAASEATQISAFRSGAASLSTHAIIRPSAHFTTRRVIIATAFATATAGYLTSRLAPSYSPLTVKLGSSFSTSSSARRPPPASDQASAGVMDKTKSEEEWRAILSPEQFRILRQKGTEMAGTGPLDKFYPKQGVFECAGCGTPLYRYDHKFDSGCGWPAFFDAIPGAIDRHEDKMFGMVRTEITCAACHGHLGHVFKGEGFSEAKTTDERHCVNSVSIKFADDKKA